MKSIKTSRKKRLQQLHRRILLSLFLCAFGIIVLFILLPNNTTASTTKSSSRKVYKSIMIQPGDTLSSIASDYMDDHYTCSQDYIQEVQNINSLVSDEIITGSYLVVPYYIDLEDSNLNNSNHDYLSRNFT